VSYSWSIASGPNSATILTAAQVRTIINNLTAGVYTVTLTVQDNAGATATKSIVVNVFNATTRLGRQNLGLYPNPVASDLYLVLNSSYVGKMTVTIYDIHGRLIQKNEMEKTLDEQTFRIQMGNIPHGTYLVKVQEGTNAPMTRKVVH
jgi:PKD repeat protein